MLAGVKMGDGRKILVLDDDEAWLSTLETLIGDEYDLTVTTLPQVAISSVSQGKFSLVIIDMKLPGTDGLQVLGEIRNLVPGICCIILTGYPDFREGVDSIKQGALDYVYKGDLDFDLALKEKISEVLSQDWPSPRDDKTVRDTQRILSLIRQGESSTLEFKSTARWDIRQGKPNNEMEKSILKTVAAFMNSDGGTLLIGVDDAGGVLGLASDFATLKRKDRDGYENFLTSIILDRCGKEYSPLIKISFYDIDGKDICEIVVSPSPKAAFVKEDKVETMYIRAGNTTRPLSGREVLEYSKIRWGS
jgi:ActR/RegA family two-component response regulator